jgi:hypothetical protein
MCASPAAAQSKLFTDAAPLQIVITAPFPALVHAAPTSRNPYPATLAATQGSEAAQSFNIQINARGLTRRTAGYCKFPPLLLTFDKAATKGTLFKGQHKLKLVTYCRDQSDYEQRIVLEYLVYKLYNVLTPMSFRARPADVTYRSSPTDTGVKRFGFLLEDIDDLADRNQREKLNAASRQIPAARLDARAAGRAALFEYMVGNLDWDFLAGPAGAECCHNSRFIAAKGAAAATATGVVPVPYDWDFSGFVDSPYAGPPEGISVAKVTDRVYRGYCASSAELPAIIAEYRAHRAEMMGLIENEPRLTANVKTKTTRFMDGFFAVLDDPDKVQKQIIAKCRQGPVTGA